MKETLEIIFLLFLINQFHFVPAFLSLLLLFNFFFSPILYKRINASQSDEQSKSSLLMPQQIGGGSSTGEFKACGVVLQIRK
jgi:hypothetical protein